MADSSRLKGIVLLPGGRWQARIMIDSKMIYLGAYDTPEDANTAYEAARLCQRERTGVSLLPTGKWRARYGKVHIGCFDTREEALEARGVVVSSQH